ncbi:PqqD family protein [Uliginosibacterium sp. TH139]|uniref:PqqD family protein n=1 Tax=Uliginosibacterium sp. TH139 TaxID=2067453 RepID=UPI000C7C6485|nr:PqqD family protein [Uliginosibacterium sp. TH139]PLK48184.1 hypothetical protein C0V76_13200 [Uliginosibacterium sp. TH139]
MNSSIFDLIKSQVPRKICIKERHEGATTIVLSFMGEIEFLNETASDIFKLIDGKRSLQDLYARLLADYDVDANTLQNDLISMVRGLQWKRLVVLSD